MNITAQIEEHINSQPEPKSAEMEQLHKRILELLPGTKLWFDDGKNSENKTVANPTIGYGKFIIKYANGTSREFFQIGMSANKTGISIYILGLADKTYLAQTYSATIGKAKITGYCIRFNKLKDINLDALDAAIQYGVKATTEG